jgi:hypothetical protein
MSVESARHRTELATSLGAQQPSSAVHTSSNEQQHRRVELSSARGVTRDVLSPPLPSAAITPATSTTQQQPTVAELRRELAVTRQQLMVSDVC